MITTFNKCCKDIMKGYPDNHFNIGIVDPPYFSGPERREYYGRSISTTDIKRTNYPKSTKWEIPDNDYFEELYRVTKNQIIWGCNYYIDAKLPAGRIVWDKCNGRSSFSDAEIAATSLHDSVRIFKYMWNGMLHGKSISEGHIAKGDKSKNEKRIHPTQKPILLYKWIISNYCNPGDLILDTHGGSGSILLACHDTNMDIVWIEKDINHFNNALDRLKLHQSQLTLDLV